MDENAEYSIVVRGELSPSWLAWFDTLEVEVSYGEGGAPLTALCGPVTDQAALRGVLCRLWDLNLTVLSVTRLEPGSVTE